MLKVMHNKYCYVCGAANSKWCTNCYSVCYCSKECQRVDWVRNHKNVCKINDKMITRLDNQKIYIVLPIKAYPKHYRDIFAYAYKSLSQKDDIKDYVWHNYPIRVYTVDISYQESLLRLAHIIFDTAPSKESIISVIPCMCKEFNTECLPYAVKIPKHDIYPMWKPSTKLCLCYRKNVLKWLLVCNRLEIILNIYIPQELRFMIIQYIVGDKRFCSKVRHYSFPIGGENNTYIL